MNNLILTEQGGHPLTLNDLAFLQSAFNEALRGILIGLDKADGVGYRLYGAEQYYNISTDTIWLTEGFVAIKVGSLAEIFYVPNHDTGQESFVDPYWIDVVTDIAPSPVTYKNLDVKNVHKQRRLSISDTGNNLLYPKYSATKQWISVLKDRLKPYQFDSTIAYESGYAGTVRHVEELHDWVTIDGAFSKSSTASANEVALTLPIGRRPISEQRIICYCQTGSGIIVVPIQIKTNGQVALPEGIGGSFQIYLQAIRFPKF